MLFAFNAYRQEGRDLPNFSTVSDSSNLREGGSGGDFPPRTEQITLLEDGAIGQNSVLDVGKSFLEPVNHWQNKYYWAREFYSKVYREFRKLSLCRRYRIDLACSNCGKGYKKIVLSCNSYLCPKCSKERWRIRTQKIFEALEPFLSVYVVWSIWTFTIPKELRSKVWNWGSLVNLRRGAIRICKEKVGGKVGVAIIQTFSSRDHKKVNPHVHLIVGGRKGDVDYIDVLEAWAAFLFDKFGYVCKRKESKKYLNGIPIVVVQEGSKINNMKGKPFLLGEESLEERKGKLYYKAMYESRLAGQKFEKGKPEFTKVDLGNGDVFKHYNIMLGRQFYCYWGEVINYFRKKPLKYIPEIQRGVYLGALFLNRQMKRRLIRELKKRGRKTHDLGNRIVGELEYQILKGIPLVLKKPTKRRFDLCSFCGEGMTVLALWDIMTNRESWIKNFLLEYLIAHFGDEWANYGFKFNQVKYGSAAA